MGFGSMIWRPKNAAGAAIGSGSPIHQTRGIRAVEGRRQTPNGNVSGSPSGYTLTPRFVIILRRQSTPMASLAIDPAHHAWGVPVFLEAALHGAPNWRGLVVTQDAGGAILGPARGDLFAVHDEQAGQRDHREGSAP